MPSKNATIDLPFHTNFSLTLAATCLIAIGCRSGRPLGSMVQVTEDPSAVVAEVPAPEQRLATAAGTKSSQQLAPSRGLAEQSKTDLASAVKTAARENQSSTESISGPTAQEVAAKMSLTDSTNTPAKSSPQTQAAIDQALAEIRAASAQSQTSKPTDAPASEAPHRVAKATAAAPHAETTRPSANRDIEVSSGGLVSASLTDLSDSDSQTKSIDATPATHRTNSQPSQTETGPAKASDQQIIQQKSTQTTSVTIPNTTTQPNALQDALKASLSHLPELPQTRGPHHGAPVKRIGSSITRHQSKPPTTTPTETPDQQVATSTSATDPPITETPKRSLDAPSAPISIAASSPAIESPAHVLNSNQVRPASHSGDNLNHHPIGSRLERIPTEIPAQPLDTPELFSQLVERLSKAPSGESPAARERRQIIRQHLMVLSGSPDAAIESMQNLNPTEQKYLQSQLMGLWTLIDPKGHPSSGRRITEALPKYREATRHMAMATDSLSLKNIEFCTEIESYGQIKPFEGNRFVSGQQVILYCEIENFAAAPKNGRFQTQLEGSYDIYNTDGTKVFSQLLPMDEQRSRNQLRDYFVAYQMNLPKGLPAGTYRLQLTIEDIVGKKYGQENIPFEIK